MNDIDNKWCGDVVVKFGMYWEMSNEDWINAKRVKQEMDMIRHNGWIHGEPEKIKNICTQKDENGHVKKMLP